MEHLYSLSLLVTDYDMVMFCDDDDTYHPLRVEAFEYTFQELLKSCTKDAKNFGGVREVINKDIYTCEYWAYGIRPSLLTTFFERVRGYEDLMRHKFADMYLRDYLRKTGGKSILFAIVPPDESCDKYYNYTIDNANSICSRHQEIQESAESANELIEENVRLALICDRKDLVKDYMRDACAPMSRLREVVPDADRIQSLTKLLYV
jgi:glycosyltransferase involved in cell wall biosynthesis